MSATSASGGAHSVNLVNVATSGTFALGSGALSGSTGDAVVLSGGAGTFTYGGSVTNAAGHIVAISGRSGGGLTLSGNLSESGTGILAQNNTGGAYTFSGATKTLSTGASAAVSLSTNAGASFAFTGGGLAITTSSGAGFSATGGGTVTVSGALNTIGSAGGTPLTVTSTTIGAGGLAFRSVAATGGTNGIVLSNTGAGGLTVSGDGASDAANTTRGRTTAKSGGGTLALGSGGTISGVTGAAISLSSVSGVVLRNMTISNSGGAVVNSGGHGIAASGVAGLTLDNVLISGVGANMGIFGTNVSDLSILHSELANNATAAGVEASDVWGARFSELTGTGLIQNSLLHHSAANIFGIQQTTATPLSLTVDNSEFRDTNAASPGNDGLLVSGTGSANVTLSVSNSSFLRDRANGVQYNMNNNAGGGSLTVHSSVFEANAIDLNVAHQGTGKTVSFDFTGNTMRQSASAAASSNSINVFLAGLSSATTVLKGTIANNVIGNAGATDSGSTGGDGINLFASGAGTLTANVTGNTVRGIKVGNAFSATSSSHTGQINITLRTNDFRITPSSSGFALAGVLLGFAGLAGDTSTMCADLAGNTAFVGDPTFFGAFVNAGAGGSQTLQLVGYAGAANDHAAIAAFLNTTATTVSPAADASTLPSSAVGRATPCPLP